ncbi:MAG: murein transglycosylase A [Alphaproteobacteria bacterium]|nr:murein transglycosylase A [Alphaproteobacteria bacterium]
MLRLCCAAICLLSGCAEKMPASETIRLTPISFAALEGWNTANVAGAIPALAKSCGVLGKKAPDVGMGPSYAGKVAEWREPCAALKTVGADDGEAAQAFFETYFTPYRINDGQDGLFTGYYQAQLRGALTKEGPYQTPLWQRPDDMLSIDLGDFREALKGQKITGKIKGHNLVPYDDRAQVAAGSLDGRAKPLVWVDDPIGAFFLEIQGSGQVVLPDGKPLYVGYDAQNGHGYTPIGRVLAERGALGKPVTMQKIRAWLAAHPDQAQHVMNQNASVVFFREQKQEGAVGAQGVTLTPLHSMAVDRSFVPLGAPLWVETANRKTLVIAQDTGGAIKGPVRGDLFWGAGPEAEANAGPMQETGKAVLFLPKTIKVEP